MADTCETCKHILISTPPDVHTWLTCLNDQLRQRYIPDLLGIPVCFTPPDLTFCCNKWEVKPSG